jgi:hypothetical protein
MPVLTALVADAHLAEGQLHRLGSVLDVVKSLKFRVSKRRPTISKLEGHLPIIDINFKKAHLGYASFNTSGMSARQFRT